MKNYKWPLMSNNISKNDKKVLVNFINRSNKFTNGPKVKEFEKKWSKYFKVKLAWPGERTTQEKQTFGSISVDTHQRAIDFRKRTLRTIQFHFSPPAFKICLMRAHPLQ